MLKKLLLGLVALVIVVVVVVMMQPAAYHIERSILIQASPDVVWAEVSDFERWKAWNPWQKMDPEQSVTVEGTPGAVGHSSSWAGEKSGKGKMTVSDAAKPTRLTIRLDFAEPMTSQATTALAIAPRGDKVEVTWSMDGENDFVGKFFGLVMNVEDMVGTAYEEGLGSLKQVAEAKAGN